jgi:hypothetical protein
VLQAAKEVVLADKPVISDDAGNLEPLLLNQLLEQVCFPSSCEYDSQTMELCCASLGGHRLPAEASILLYGSPSYNMTGSVLCMEYQYLMTVLCMENQYSSAVLVK